MQTINRIKGSFSKKRRSTPIISGKGRMALVHKESVAGYVVTSPLFSGHCKFIELASEGSDFKSSLST